MGLNERGGDSGGRFLRVASDIISQANYSDISQANYSDISLEFD